MMNTLLVPLDGSALAEQSLPYVRTLAGLLGARVRLLRVITETPDGDLLAESIGSVYGMHEPLTVQRERQQHTFDMLRQKAERYLTSHAELMQADGLDVAVDSLLWASCRCDCRGRARAACDDDCDGDAWV